MLIQQSWNCLIGSKVICILNTTPPSYFFESHHVSGKFKQMLTLKEEREIHLFRIIKISVCYFLIYFKNVYQITTELYFTNSVQSKSYYCVKTYPSLLSNCSAPCPSPAPCPPSYTNFIQNIKLMAQEKGEREGEKQTIQTRKRLRCLMQTTLY